jgi:hypothetical protein
MAQNEYFDLFAEISSEFLRRTYDSLAEKTFDLSIKLISERGNINE